MPDVFVDALAGFAGRIETVLEAILSPAANPGTPARLMEAMGHAALGGGKRLRPFLLCEAARLCGAEEGQAFRAGAAVELVHVYSLVHDDLPAMDDDDLRRGRPTVHRAYDEATAILVGDALQTLAFEVLADPQSHSDPLVRSALVLELARAAGASGMAGGQMLDLGAEGRFGAGGRLDAPAVRTLQGMKTGALLAAAVVMGGILAGASPETLAALQRYGTALGAAFQVADDILDVEASSAELGKAAGKDAGRGKATLVEVLGLEGARGESARLAAEAEAALSGFGEAADLLRRAARFAVERRSVINPVQALWLRPRLIVAILLGLALVWVLPGSWGLSSRLLTAWCSGVAAYCVMAAVLMSRLDRDNLQKKASKLDDTSLEILLLCALATAASLVAVGAELSGIKSLPAAEQGLHLGLTIATLVCSWAFIQVVFSIHYAHIYYGDDEASRKAGEDYRGGLKFGGDDDPDFWDFLYFTVSVGATSQTSDTEVTSRTMRRIVLAQSVLSFFFNTAVLALGINIAASLLG